MRAKRHKLLQFSISDSEIRILSQKKRWKDAADKQVVKFEAKIIIKLSN